MSEENIIQLFKSHEDRDAERFKDIHDTLEEIRETLKPISEAFTSVSLLGKWGMGLIITISVVIGIIMSVLKIPR